ncbi:MAG: hypothetical protein IT359_13500 [Gemmatimonadaceae bacterium]|nr:hypothetical protein [Gemmatimonadaceae bacterium]
MPRRVTRPAVFGSRTGTAIVALGGALALCSVPGRAHAQLPAQSPARQLTVQVLVRDSATRNPVAGARLFARLDSTRTVQTDGRGTARLDFPVRPGDSLVVVRRGFRRYARALDDSGIDFMALDITLAPAVQELSELRVEDRNSNGVPEGRWADFERRRISGSLGKFLTETDIDRRRPVRMTDLFRGMATVRVVDSASTRLVVSNRGANPSLVSKSAGGGPCVLRIMVDGIVRAGISSLDDLDPKEIHGIEIYVGPGSVPPSLTGMQRESWCGLVAVWTK